MFFFLFRRLKPTAILFFTKFFAEADGNLFRVIYSIYGKMKVIIGIVVI
jgi:hypothetical protein